MFPTHFSGPGKGKFSFFAKNNFLSGFWKESCHNVLYFIYIFLKNEKIKSDKGGIRTMDPIRDAREFAVSFVCAVTETSDNQSDLFPKNGSDSVFGLLERVFPQVRV